MIAPLLHRQGRGARRGDDRKILNGIFDILRTGGPWRDLPERYGPRTTFYNRYVLWGRKGVWNEVPTTSLLFVGSLQQRNAEQLTPHQ